MNILVVDDIEDNLILVRCILEGEGYSVRAVASGEECLAEVARHVPDLLLLDVHMPRMGGLETLAHLRSDPGLPPFPVLLVTAMDLDGETVGASGADGLMLKPFSIDGLLERVQALLQPDGQRSPDTPTIHRSDLSFGQ